MLFRVRSGPLLYFTVAAIACFFCPVAVNIYQASDVGVTRTLVSTLKESKAESPLDDFYDDRRNISRRNSYRIHAILLA